jgi:hypothetical protein
MAGAAAPAQSPLPARKTLGQMFRDQGSNPDEYDPYLHLYAMQIDIPRNFPVPANSFHLLVSNAVSRASVQGPTPPETDSFYQQLFRSEGWDVLKHQILHSADGGMGITSFVACLKDKCVGLSCGAVGTVENPNTIDFTFMKRSEVLP